MPPLSRCLQAVASSKSLPSTRRCLHRRLHTITLSEIAPSFALRDWLRLVLHLHAAATMPLSPHRPVLKDSGDSHGNYQTILKTTQSESNSCARQNFKIWISLSLSMSLLISLSLSLSLHQLFPLIDLNPSLSSFTFRSPSYKSITFLFVCFYVLESDTFRYLIQTQ